MSFTELNSCFLQDPWLTKPWRPSSWIFVIGSDGSILASPKPPSSLHSRLIHSVAWCLRFFATCMSAGDQLARKLDEIKKSEKNLEHAPPAGRRDARRP